MDETVWELPSGLRVLHRHVPATRLVHAAMVLDVGSRDEAAPQAGMAHFIEHMIFKGTRKRKAYHILSRIDSVGGELNAFTTKEKTVYYATVTGEHTRRATELLHDITYHSTFPAREVEKEKTVIAEEIDMYRDDPEESIFEDFDQLVFGGHPLAHPITGSKDGILQFSNASLLEFFGRHYVPSRSVLVLAGNLTEAQARRFAQRDFADLPATGTPPIRTAPAGYTPQHAVYSWPVSQAHFLLGGAGYPLRHPRYMAFALLMNLLGGPSSNSRLNLNIRERYGLAYNIQTHYQPFVDSGVWGIYAGCEKRNLARVQRLVHRELHDLRTQALSTATLARVKKQFVGQLVISQESLFNQMLAQAKDLLDFGAPTPFSELLAQVDALTPQDLLAAANEQFDPDRLSLLVFEPEP